MSKHTPGPWAVQDDSPTSIWAGGHYIAETYTDGEANAALVAAAPDMLAALQRVWDDMQGGLGPSKSALDRGIATRAAVRAAIAKAEAAR